jgi:hypothetical protein
MMRLLPEGYISRHEAVAILERALFAGEMESSTVRSLRANGLSVREREARTKAVEALWKGVDEGHVHAFVVSGGLGAIMTLMPDQTKQVPMLQHPDGGTFDYLRRHNRLHDDLVDALRKSSGNGRVSAADLSRLSLAFRPDEVEQYARRVLRTRRRRQRSDGRLRGRPNKLDRVEAVILDIKQKKGWNPTESIKRMTQLINRKLSPEEHVGETTVARALDRLYVKSGNREFQRTNKRKTSRSGG